MPNPHVREEWLLKILESLDLDPGTCTRASRNDAHSNEIRVLAFEDGRHLIVKRGRHDWSETRFRAAALASTLIRRETDIRVPRPLEVEEPGTGFAVEVYWRVELPTLLDLWPELPEGERGEVLRSLGRLLRRLHQVETPGWGAFGDELPTEQDVGAAVGSDLGHRLAPAVAALWTDGLPPLERLIDKIPELLKWLRGRAPTLAHGDIHMGNILCEQNGDEVRCVGLLDLEACAGAPAETDLASVEILHGPLFTRPLEARWLQHVREGYGGGLDEDVLSFFRAVHLANLGFHAALSNEPFHAGRVAHAFESAVDALTETTGAKR